MLFYKAMDKHVFIAIPLEDELRKKIAAWAENFSKRVKIPLHWVKNEGLHITLIPPWQIKDRELESLKRLMPQALHSIMPFEFELRRILYGPDSLRPRLIWAEGETPAALEELQKRLLTTAKTGNIGFHTTEEKRPLKLHVTLARFRPETFSMTRHETIDEEIKWYGMASAVAIMQSVRRVEGSEYYILEKYQLF